MPDINKVLFSHDQSALVTKSQQKTARKNIGIPDPGYDATGLVLKCLYGGSLSWLRQQCEYFNDFNSSMTEATETDNTNGYSLYTLPTRYVEGRGILMLYRMYLTYDHAALSLSYYYSDFEVYFGTEDDLTPARSLIYRASLSSPGPNGVSGENAVYQIAFPGTWNQGNLWTLKFIKNVNCGTTLAGTQINYSTGFIKF